MLQHQNELPSLPLPDLSSTLEKYLKSVRPLSNDTEYEHTRSLCKEFENGVGQQFQEILQDRAKEERNWIEEWWENYAYLQPVDFSKIALHFSKF